MSYLTITGPNGAVVNDRSFRPLATIVRCWSRCDLQWRPYEVVSYQRPCDGNCDHLDGPRDRCASSFDVAAGAVVDSGRAVCSHQRVHHVDRPHDRVADTRRDRVGGRTCRTVASTTPNGFVESRAQVLRRRLPRGVAAQVVTNTSPNYLDVVRFDDNVITVYRKTPGLAKTSTWTKRTCTGLKPQTEGYELKGCAAFVSVL